MKTPSRVTMMPSRIAVADMRTARPAPKEVDPHYSSGVHREWREAVKVRAGGMCEWPGCGISERRMYADHIKERSDGGAELDLDNGQCLCAHHHTIKTNQERARRMAR